mgnify:CR=1 FL=1|tara:strand:- start:239 stop:700 length:462 start_codon:yes stop_codon:yes gene_type:complete
MYRHKHIQNIITLGELNIGDKLYLDNGILYKDERYMPWLRRYLTGVSREDIVQELFLSYSKIFLYFHLPKLIRKEETQQSISYSKYLKKLIDKSINGLENLNKTYAKEFNNLNYILTWIKKERRNMVICYDIGDVENTDTYDNFIHNIFNNKN